MTHKDKLVALLKEMGVEYDANEPRTEGTFSFPFQITVADEYGFCTHISFDDKGQFTEWRAYEL